MPSNALLLRSALRAGEEVPTPLSLSHWDWAKLAADGLASLFTVDVPPRLAAIRSLVLPPTCSQLRFDPLSPLPPAAGPAFDLRGGPDRHWAQLIEARKDRSWWMQAHPERLSDLRARLAAVADVELAVREMLADRFGEVGPRSVRALTLTGSYLWAEDQGTDIDVIAHVDLGPAHVPNGMDHWQRVPAVVGGVPMSVGASGTPTLDLLLVGTHLLQRPQEAKGHIGEWREHDDRVLPYDLSRPTILAAIRQTLAAAVPIYGPDPFAAIEQRAPDLLALARYFLQEASVLLDERRLVPKASQRVHEALLILGFLERREPRSASDSLRKMTIEATEAVRSLHAAPDDPEILASLQGWWGRRPEGLLDRACRALVESARARGIGDRTPAGGALEATVRRSRQLQEPGWRLLRSRLDSLGTAGRILELIDALVEGPESTADRPGYAVFVPYPSAGDSARPADVDEALERLLLVHSHADPADPADQIAAVTQQARRLELGALQDTLLDGVPVGYWLGDPFSLGSNR
jgi:hypothetical protein